MKTISINIFKFNELSEQAKDNAVEKLRDINLHDDWYECTIDDAATIGLKIESFDVDRGSHVQGVFTEDATKVADLIIANHGEHCETHKTAARFWEDWNFLVEKHSDGVDTSCVAYENEQEFDNEANELEQEFLNDLCECYLTILRNEYEYLYSEEAVIETIEANDYDFTEDGNLY